MYRQFHDGFILRFFDTGWNGVSKQMGANPKVEICAWDSSSGSWLRIEAVVVNDDRLVTKHQLPELKSMYSADDDNIQVLYLKKDVTATFSSFQGEPKVIKF